MSFILLLLFVSTALGQTEPWLPRELGRFPLTHAGFVEAFEVTDFAGQQPADKFTLYISTFDALQLFVQDPVFILRSPGTYLTLVDTWDQLVEPLSPRPTAFWPNSMTRLSKEVSGFDGIVQTSGFIPPGKRAGQLEVFNMESIPAGGPWNIAGLDPEDYSYHWVEWKDVDADGLQDIFAARFHIGSGGSTTSQLVWMKNPGNLGPDGENWSSWEQHLLVEGGPDVYINSAKLSAEGKEYDVLVAGELWSKRIVIYYVEDGPGAWMNPADIRSNIVDDEQGVPFKASFVDLNMDGTMEIVASAINESIPSGGAFWLYQQPADFRTDRWEKSIIASGFTPNFEGNSMSPGDHKLFYPSMEYSEQTTEFGSMKPWIWLSGDDDGKHYVLYPTSEERDDFTYEMHLVVETGGDIAGSMTIADLDGDGYVEVVLAGYTAGVVFVHTYAPL